MTKRPDPRFETILWLANAATRPSVPPTTQHVCKPYVETRERGVYPDDDDDRLDDLDQLVEFRGVDPVTQRLFQVDRDDPGDDDCDEDGDAKDEDIEG